MLPPVMLFRPDMARRMIGSRTRVLDQVKRNAKEAGFDGAKFPWEQATTGKTSFSSFFSFEIVLQSSHQLDKCDLSTKSFNG